MAFDAMGLGLAASSAVQYRDQQRMRDAALAAQQQQYQDNQRKQQALALMLSGIGQQNQGAPQPMQPMQPVGAPAPVPMQTGPQMGGGAPQPGMAPPMPQGQPAMMPPPRAFSPQQPVAPPMPGGGPQLPPQLPNVPGGGPQGGGGQPGQATPLLTQMAGFKQKIMAANPNADPGAVSLAVMQLADLASKDNTNETRLLALQLTQQNRFDIAMEQIQGRLAAVDKQQQGAGDRVATQQSGADKRAALSADAQAQHQQAQQAFTMARDNYLRGFSGMRDADKVKVRGALQKWQGALANQRTIINAQPDDDDAQKKAADAVDAAEANYNSIKLGGGDTAAPAPAAGGVPKLGAGGGAPAAGAVPKPPAGVPAGAKYSPSQKSWWWQDNGAWKSAPGS